MGLRTSEGLCTDTIAYHSNGRRNLATLFNADVVQRLQSDGFLEPWSTSTRNRLRATSKGLQVLDQLILKLASNTNKLDNNNDNSTDARGSIE
jgi:hypothetical protein